MHLLQDAIKFIEILTNFLIRSLIFADKQNCYVAERILLQHIYLESEIIAFVKLRESGLVRNRTQATGFSSLSV